MPDWRSLHQAAVRENDKAALEKLVYETETAIYLRLQELAREQTPSVESQQIKTAIQELLEIKIQKLGWPDPLPTHDNTGYDLFCGDPKNDPLWITHTDSFAEALTLMHNRAGQSPGRYFIFSLRTHQVLAEVDGTN